MKYYNMFYNEDGIFTFYTVIKRLGYRKVRNNCGFLQLKYNWQGSVSILKPYKMKRSSE